MSFDRLRLNSDKAQFIWLGGRAQLAKIDMEFLRATFPDVHYSVSVRDLGVSLDPVLSFSDHVNRISRTCLYHLRQIRTVRHSLSPHAVNTLVHALICTRVDFGNSIFAGLSSLNLSKLQSILNASARLICGLPKYSHISTFIRETLHWLPVPHSIQNSHTYAQLSARGSSFIPPGLMHIGFYTPWSLCSALCRQRPSGCPSHAWCNCSIQKLCLCRPLQLEPSSA